MISSSFPLVDHRGIPPSAPIIRRPEVPPDSLRTGKGMSGGGIEATCVVEGAGQRP